MQISPRRFWRTCVRSSVRAAARVLFLMLVVCVLVSASARAGEVSLSWLDNATNETGYKIERSMNGGAFAELAVLAANSTSYRDTTGVVSMAYSYRVRAYNAVGDSAFSNVVAVTIPPVTPANTAPVITDVANRTLAEDTSSGTIAFTVSDAESAAGSLVVSATSSNSTLLPASGLVLGGSGASRTLTIAPAAHQSGTATVTLTVSDGTLSASDSFVVTVNAVNDLPAISAIADRAVNSGTSTGAIAFSIGDVETAAGSLVVSASSSNSALVPLSAIVLGGSGASRTIAVTPAAGQSGAATITVSVSDGQASTSEVFVLTVNAVANSAPTISNLPNRTISEDGTTGAIAFTVGDAQTAAGNLAVSASSSNPTLVPASSLTLGGSGANRTLAISPAANRSGSAIITVTVSDGALSRSDTFTLTVSAVNDVPTISNLLDRSVNTGVSTGPMPFTIADVETSASSLTVTASSSNTTLVPTSGLVLGGSGASRTLTVRPAAGKSGTATITVRVSDGTASATDTFVLTVNGSNTAPTISDIANRTVAEDNTTGAIAFTIGDAQTAAASLSVSASSSNTALVPASGLVLGGSGASRTIAVTPAVNASGSATISVIVSDGTLSATDTFVVTVTAVNDAPTISAIAPVSIERGAVAGPISFSVGDVETSAGSLTVTTSSSDPTLVPANAIVLGGSGANRTITITPVASGSGGATITLTVSDGTATATSALALTVTFTSHVLAGADIGTPSLAGSTTTATNGVITIRAGGRDLASTSDQFHFAHQTVQGDVEVIVRVGSLGRTHGWARAGVMFRSSLAANAPYVGVFVTPDYGVVMQARAASGGQTYRTPSLAGNAPEWLRLLRTGDAFYAFRSEDGVNWELVEFGTVPLPSQLYVGLAVTSASSTTLTTATFDSFELDW